MIMISRAYLVVGFFFLSSFAVSSMKNIEKGDIVCSHSDMLCGIVLSCNVKKCATLRTHIIQNNTPSRMKPEYTEKVNILKSKMYLADATTKTLMKKSKDIVRNGSSRFYDSQSVCYTVNFSNSTQQETRCGSILGCNNNSCRIRKTHIKTTHKTKQGKRYSVLEFPPEYQSSEEVKKKNIIRDGQLVEEFIFWKLMNIEIIKLLH